MPELDVQFWIDDRDDVVSYRVEGQLKRPGDAIAEARERAVADGHDEVNLKEVRLAEPA